MLRNRPFPHPLSFVPIARRSGNRSCDPPRKKAQREVGNPATARIRRAQQSGVIFVKYKDLTLSPRPRPYGTADARSLSKTRCVCPGAEAVMQSGSTRLEHFLKLYRVPYSLIPHAPTFRSQMAAAALHVPGRMVAKAVVLSGAAQSYLAVLPASYHVDLDRMSDLVGEPVRLAPEARIRELFPDCELGAIPPFGRLYGVPVYVDVTLAVVREIVFPAGSHRDALRMSFQDFEALARPEVCSFAIKDAGLRSVPAREKGRERT